MFRSNPADAPDRRVQSIDVLRGLIMILMALDHTRDYLSSADFDPLDLQRTWPALFLTRWITHYCAPLFIFLSGVSAFLSSRKTADLRHISRFLAIRGVLLIVLEITVMRWFGWNFGFQMERIRVGVLWAIGWSMIVLAGLIHWPRRTIATVGLILILGHNLLDPVLPETLGSFGWLWKVLHAGGSFDYWPGLTLSAGYPLIPWIGVMAAGYAFGPVFLLDPSERQPVLWRWGAAASALFILLRVGNLYGDPGYWTAQSDDVRTLLSMLDCKKYPPSLHYLLMTLGPGLMLLALLERFRSIRPEPLILFGQVPLFFYLLHLPAIHALAVLADFGRYGHTEWQFGWPFATPRLPHPPDHGFGLLIVYLAAVFVVCCLYPACRWFAAFKRRHPANWVRYL